ncbi:MAG: hypothetical protein KC635_14280, partial [Myxococcales bacterium]|nr:hypothetical protein [Myxococcales bacterium]
DAESAAAVAKGDGTCVPSEAATPYAATAWVAPATPEPGCLAMTRDGKMAAFLLARDDFMPGDDGEAPAGKSRRVDWYGPEGDEPEEGGPVDLSCLAKGCDDAQREALAAAAAKADLVACRDALAGGVVASDRRAALTVTKDGEPAAEEVVLKRGNGEANVLISLTMTDGDGGDHQILKGAYQLPGGSLFVLWDNGDTGFIDMGVTAVGAAKLGLCAP